MWKDGSYFNFLKKKESNNNKEKDGLIFIKFEWEKQMENIDKKRKKSCEK